MGFPHLLEAMIEADLPQIAGEEALFPLLINGAFLPA